MNYTVDEVRRLAVLYKTSPQNVHERLALLRKSPTEDAVILALGDSPVGFKKNLLQAVLLELEGNEQLCSFAKEWAETPPYWHCGWGTSSTEIRFKGEKVGKI